MLLRKLLFETRLGDALLAGLERLAGLAVVELGEVQATEMRIIGARERAPILAD